MAQVAPEHASRRLGLRTPKAVAAAGIASMALLGTFGALHMQAQPVMFASARPSQETLTNVEVEDDEDGATGEPLLLEPIVVHIDGAVVYPGVYTLSGDPVRLNDAVDAAGGLADDADTTSVNLAQPLADGTKAHIPAIGGASASASPGTGEGSGLVNLNTADAESLMELPGVGEQTARAIIESREELGPFTSVDDLMRVSGIGEKKLEKIRPYACV